MTDELLLAALCINSLGVACAEEPPSKTDSLPEEVRAAVEKFQGPLTNEVYNDILDVLRRHGARSTAALPAIMKEVPQLSPNAAEMLAETIACFGDGAADQLVVYASDADPRIRLTAVRALGRMKNGAAHSTCFVNALADSSIDVRRAAVRFLQKAPLESAYQPLKRVFEDRSESEELRISASLAMARIDSSRSADAVRELLGAKDRASRRAAYLILGYSGEVDPLVRVLRSHEETDPFAQWDLVMGIASTRHEKAGEVLSDMLRDPKSWREIRVTRSQIERSLRYVRTGKTSRDEREQMLLEGLERIELPAPRPLN